MSGDGGGFSPDSPGMWPGRPGHVARTARTCGPDGADMWSGGPDSPDMWPGRLGHVARTARTCGPDGPDAAPIMASARVDMFPLAGGGGFDGCRLKKWKELSLFFFFRGVGGGGRLRWLMYEEMLGSFILSFGSPG